MIKTKGRILFLLMICFLLIGTSAVHAKGQNTKSKKEEATTIGNVTDISADGNTYIFSAGKTKVRVVFYEHDMFRIQMAPDGKFTDPTKGKIVLKDDLPSIKTQWDDAGDYYKISSKHVVLRVYKHPMRFALYKDDNKTLIWKETKGLTWTDDKTVQTLSRGGKEQFFGGGMQNGRFSHRGEKINISTSYNWNNGGHPNPSPFYMSTKGYGVFRNTFASGTYSFNDPVKASENEKRFDAYYFYGPSLKDILDGYTELTGRPFMPPIYGLELGDSDCYNEDGETTTDALKIADGYKKHDFPAGWMLVNDGYGCGYENLEKAGKELRDRHIQLGLWTEDGLKNGKWEVQKAGVRVRKLDVAWVGPGYEFAFDAAKSAFDNIEANSNSRGFVWMVEGWAGTQRHAVMWTGDQTGSWDNIRFTIPTIAGSGLSGMAYTASDVDGIFGGSPETYVRDLQWKTLTPVLMTMSGWAPKDKQPWVYGEPYTSINRKYLDLHERLLPYIYSYADIAHETGVPPVRSLVLEYPNDPNTWDDTTKYEFMLGESFLVAPVYKDSKERNGIYLPKGTWVDYWNGKVYKGPRLINNYSAPLDKLPLFVKAGAIVPMRAPNTNDYDRAQQRPLTLDLYPQGNSDFSLYMDDGVTREYKEGASAKQHIKMSAPKKGRGNVKITVGALKGKFAGKPEHRGYELTLHTGKKPANVAMGKGEKLKQYKSRDAFDKADNGWFYDKHDRGGIVHVKTTPMSVDKPFTITLHGTSSIGGKEADPAALTRLQAPDKLTPAKPAEVKATFLNGSDADMKNVDLSLDLPDGWSVQPKTDTNFKKVKNGQKVTAVFTVTAPDETKEGIYSIIARADFKQRGREYSASEIDDTYVINPYKIPQSQMTASATSEQTGSDPASHAIDGDPNTMWHTDWSGSDHLPQSITVDLGGTYNINEIKYLPRQSGTNGIITKYKLYVSTDGKNFREVSSGTWDNDKKEKGATFNAIDASYIKLEAIEGVNGFASAAEINVFKTKK
ncbi:glycosyl hydrolase family 31 [Scopulibacillus darangshiensis]|uniref:Glycosyl hydrolase family 31 n=1 Tax=Scopulibacillus darangshiensis TaxID=442528 RepID=A0A4R2P481_9BACL|nr:discoidin domain-containing protein [Scopulibacillus darangshiensis]TCP29619.1 glycosyl hydrolase family 31 [Scopulibacillus darangshiensis]